MIDDLQRRVAKGVLRGWPAAVAKISEGLHAAAQPVLSEEDLREVAVAFARYLPNNLQPKVTVEGSSEFVQHMAQMEGMLRTEAVREGCCCRMVLRVTNAQATPGGLVLSIGTAHDAPCPWLAKFRADQQEVSS